jgi:O-succinylbenzoate synthase
MLNGVDTWIGGNVELTSPGKAHALAMASHPGVTLPSDISGTDAYFLPGVDPCTAPMQREAGGAYIKVPQAVGRGFDVDTDKLKAITTQTIIFQA